MAFSLTAEFFGLHSKPVEFKQQTPSIDHVKEKKNLRNFLPYLVLSSEQLIELKILERIDLWLKHEIHRHHHNFEEFHTKIEKDLFVVLCSNLDELDRLINDMNAIAMKTCIIEPGNLLKK